MPRKKVIQRELVFNKLFEPLFDDSLDCPRYYNVYGGRLSAPDFI